MTEQVGHALEIGMYLHCRLCANDVLSGRVTNTSPEHYARLNVGWTQRGLQVWCVRHDCNVVNIDFEGHQHPANTGRKLDA